MGKKIPLEELDKSTLIKRLDDIFSWYIRLSWANSDGYCTCITCGTKIFWKYIQNGHWQGRTIWNLRWDEDNCRPQCQPCNSDMSSSRTATYQLRLTEELGQERITEMLKISSDKPEWRVEKQWYIDSIIYYDGKVQKLLKRIPEKLFT